MFIFFSLICSASGYRVSRNTCDIHQVRCHTFTLIVKWKDEMIATTTERMHDVELITQIITIIRRELIEYILSKKVELRTQQHRMTRKKLLNSVWICLGTWQSMRLQSTVPHVRLTNNSFNNYNNKSLELSAIELNFCRIDTKKIQTKKCMWFSIWYTCSGIILLVKRMVRPDQGTVPFAHNTYSI